MGDLGPDDLRAVREVREKFAAVFSAPEARIAAP
ncbi:CGNR zinc finger domain-containing protein [Streptomyces tanashiensis]